MKRMWLCVTAVLIVLSMPNPAAFADSEDDPETPMPEQSKVARQLRRNEQRRRELQYLEELRRTVINELNLADDQLKAVMEHFKEHTHFVEQYEPKPAEDDDGEERRQQRRKLHRELRKARQAQDYEAVSELTAKMRSLRTQDSLRRATGEFHRAVANELDEERKRQFRKIVRRLYKYGDRLRDRATGIRRMRRALDGLDLSNEQRAAVKARFAKAMKAFGEGGYEPETAGKIEQQMQAGILEELTEEQRETFLANLEKLRKEPKFTTRGMRKPMPPEREPPLVPEEEAPARQDESSEEPEQ